ncbi:MULTISPECIES: ABC transporter substrate-binding protein [Nocardia]|uniref:Sugar ABC transporter substrate-binding protein n=1 Tax=Nocardia sputorum TaxID=2984338 RepID=A0ABM8CX95_9NOCA|nr:extracellular solute-binding protein [Nocardia sputorum]BDT90978.1 sugar ABC transporter substrate-binding protein [Nocardia sputorum]BDT99610.1 sugar ABC transporter substrate-binding protein [Nocardia sputorum]
MGTRRAVLQAGTLLPLVAACAPDLLLGSSDAVRVGVSWSGQELAAFHAVLDGLDLGFAIEVIPLGDNTDTAFTAGGPSAPDVVLLPQAGRVRELAGDHKLRPVADRVWTDELGSRYAQPWQALLRSEGRLYGVPFKAADKSLLWFDRQQFDSYGLGAPAAWTLADWVDRMEVLAQTPIRLLALPAADGWALTDFFENVLLAESPRIYDDLASKDSREWDNPAVRAAFGHLGVLWGQRHAFPGGVGVALTRQFSDAVREVFQHRRAAAVVAPDFAEPIVRSAVRASGRTVEDAVGVVPFPAVTSASGRPKIVGGDVMVVTRQATPRADELVERLAGARAPLPWIERYGGFLAPNLRTEADYSPLLAPSARELAARSTFDLSDRIGPVGGREGLWRVLTEFLIAIGDGAQRRVAESTDRAIAALDDVERRRR